MSSSLQEVSDSDSDPEIMDISAFTPPPSNNNPTLLPPQALNPTSPTAAPAFDTSKSKTWTCLYPLYFDKSRTRASGRRVSSALAVSNPLARTLVDAVAALGLNVVFEPGKTHPKDWANPGRVRVQLVLENGKRGGRGDVKNKHHLYVKVAAYLGAHPTTPEDPLRLPIRGLPTPEGPIPPPEVPRGWKVNSILPLHSPAMTGGGVSEDFLKDVMAEMQGGLPGGVGGSGGGGQVEKRKEKKKKGKA
ncbi:signal recognition particle, SRP19 subunit [Trichodelitschia bisporula]|uniref:Signal recognition particle, SRP19 subunit n=1 Tax=Trichodelitschia bisporula TaxID=703511 RepID=A0A6G1HJM0_9PEZI|nr:signal recognition particle, SRP19 subunit [Trichodelitschia bisporula]